MMERPTPPRPLRPHRSWGRLIFRFFLLLFVVGAATAGVVGYRVLKSAGGDKKGVLETAGDLSRGLRAQNPQDLFGGKARLYILGLGIDANTTSRGIMYTKNARSDTIFAVSLDLVNKSIGMLSIPRDTRVELAYGRGVDKINAAHAIGEVPLAKATVEQFLGVSLDHYVVIRTYGTENFINAIGGVWIDVEKDMDYDDNWGNLHIHLKKGWQRLNGKDAVGYIRFRHDNESDFGRMRRQQQLVKAVSKQMMTPSTLLHLDRLMKVARENIITDLKDDQLIALARAFYSVPPERIHTGSVPGYDYRGDNGVWYLDPSESKKQALVGWLLQGDERFRNGLITIRVHNASGVNGASQVVRDILTDQGYRVVVGRSVRGPYPDSTAVVDVVRKGEAVEELARLFPNTQVRPPDRSERPEPGGPEVLLYIGKDCARALTRDT